MRFRVRNIVGWSDFSPVANFIAADNPTEPKAPTVLSFNSTHILLELD